jgi:hypothetical protein
MILNYFSIIFAFLLYVILLLHRYLMCDLVGDFVCFCHTFFVSVT